MGKDREVRSKRRSVLREAVDLGQRRQLEKTYKTSRWQLLVEQVERDRAGGVRRTVL